MSATPPLIAHVIHHLFIGGMENGVVNLINKMAPDRYRHCVICAEDFSDFRDRIERPDVRVLAIHKSALSRLALFRRLRATIRELRPTIVHTRNLSGLDALLPSFVEGVPIRIHGEHGWDIDDLHGARLRPRLLRRVHSPLVNRYVAVSKDLERYLTARVGVSPSRIAQIYNGVDVERFGPSSSKPIGIMPPSLYGADKVVIGAVGRLQAVKDQTTLVRALGKVLRQRPQLREVARLAIVGEGPQREAVAACVIEEGIADITWLAGARNDVAHLYQCIDVFVLPSLNEGVSNTLLEAMATGLPVIATAVGGNVELIDDGVNGILVPATDPDALAEGITAYLDDGDLRTRHGKASRLRAVRNFSIDAMVNSYASLYDTMLMRKR